MTEPHASPASSGGGLHDNPDLWLPRLTRILDDQVALYRTLSELADRQSGAISKGDTDALLSLLGQRQNYVERITALNEDLTPFTSRWDELSQKLPESRKHALRERIDELETLAKSIAKSDERDRVILEKQRDDVSGQLGGVTQQRSAANAYANGALHTHVPRYQDRRG